MRVTCISLILAFLPFAAAAADKWSAKRALAAVEAGQIILIDIRSAAEWQRTGVARGALPLDMTSPFFAEDLTRVLRARKSRPVAIICATGIRSARLAATLEAQGHAPVINVAEGMRGNLRGVGWIALGLPVVTAREAARALPPD